MGTCAAIDQLVGGVSTMKSRRKPQGHLFRKYLLLFVILISGALLASGLLESYFAYQEHKTALIRLQRATARRGRQDRAVCHGDPAPD